MLYITHNLAFKKNKSTQHSLIEIVEKVRNCIEFFCGMGDNHRRVCFLKDEKV